MGSSSDAETLHADNFATKLEIGKIISHLLGEVFNAPMPNRNPIKMWEEHKFIREKIERITELQSQMADTDARIAAKRGSDSLAEFLTWCTNKGITWDGVEVDEDPTVGFQLIATRDLGENEVLVKVPRKAIISHDQVVRSAALRKLYSRDHLLSQMDNVALAFGICALQLKGDSGWSPYLDILPATFHTPLCFSLQEFEELRPSPTFEDALSHFKAVARQFCYFLSVIEQNDAFDALRKSERQRKEPPPLYGGPFTVGNFTFGLYRWAVCAVSTRINFIPSEFEKTGDVPKKVPCLIPLLDFANHSYSDNWKHFPGYTDDLEFAVLPSNEPVRAGEPVTIQYGIRTSADFFLYNAFCPKLNPYHKYKLRIGLSKTDKFLEERMRLIAELGYGGRSPVYIFDLFHADERGGMPFDEALISFVCIFIANPPDESVGCLESQAKAVSFIATRVSLLLRGYERKEEGTGAVADLHRHDKAILQEVLAYCSTWKPKTN